MEVSVTFINDCNDLVWDASDRSMAMFYERLGWFPFPDKWLTFKEENE